MGLGTLFGLLVKMNHSYVLLWSLGRKRYTESASRIRITLIEK